MNGAETCKKCRTNEARPLTELCLPCENASLKAEVEGLKDGIKELAVPDLMEQLAEKDREIEMLKHGHDQRLEDSQERVKELEKGQLIGLGTDYVFEYFNDKYPDEMAEVLKTERGNSGTIQG